MYPKAACCIKERKKKDEQSDWSEASSTQGTGSNSQRLDGSRYSAELPSAGSVWQLSLFLSFLPSFLPAPSPSQRVRASATGSKAHRIKPHTHQPIIKLQQADVIIPTQTWAHRGAHTHTDTHSYIHTPLQQTHRRTVMQRHSQLFQSPLWALCLGFFLDLDAWGIIWEGRGAKRGAGGGKEEARKERGEFVASLGSKFFKWWLFGLYALHLSSPPILPFLLFNSDSKQIKITLSGEQHTHSVCILLEHIHYNRKPQGISLGFYVIVPKKLALACEGKGHFI